MVVLGRIVVPYGIAGWVKIHAFGDDPVSWRKIARWWLASSPEADDWSARKLEGLRFHGKSLIAKFEGVDDRTAAERLDGQYVGAPREELPKNAADEFYWDELIGLDVMNEAGESLGKVASLIESGAHPVLVVRDGEGDAAREHLLPFVAQVVKEVAVAERRVVVAWGKDW